MNKPFRYAESRVVNELSDCYFYHTMNIPGHGEVRGDWDLRAAMPGYLGNFDFRGKRVLDVGAASGFLSFAMEQQGAEVVSFDLEDGAQWNLVPHHKIQHDLPQMRLAARAAHQRLQNGYWYAHRRLGSRAKAYYGTIYDLPAELGEFDVAVLGLILGHLRDPFGALSSVARLCRGSIIVTNRANEWSEPVARFLPHADSKLFMLWWALNVDCLTRMFEVLGFAPQTVVKSAPKCLVDGQQQVQKCRTLVVKRFAGNTIFGQQKACA